jgi:hypothetical protein
MNDDTTNSGKQQTHVRNISVLQINVLNSGTEGLCMHTSSLVYQAAYVTGIYLTHTYSTLTANFNVIRSLLFNMKQKHMHSW